jgi:aminopeptidase N
MSLTQDRAEHRSKVIKINSIRYNFFLHLREGQGYSGLAILEFQLSHVPQHLHIDFNGKNIKGLVVNNQSIEDLEQKEKGFITLEGKTLKSEQNEVLVHYENDYDNDGSGCVSYVDEIDKRQYLYTHFEPYAANKVFPCFDQPNLKAPMTLTVIAPKLWTILSN